MWRQPLSTSQKGQMMVVVSCGGRVYLAGAVCSMSVAASDLVHSAMLAAEWLMPTVSIWFCLPVLYQLPLTRP